MTPQSGHLSSIIVPISFAERCRAVAGEMLVEGNTIEDAADEFGPRRLAVLDGLSSEGGRRESLRAISSGLHRNPLRFVAVSQAHTSTA